MSIVPIPAEEYRARRQAVNEAARAQGLDGLVICSRGGGTLDRYADVLYLANFYTSFPYIPDLEGQWSGRAHTFLVLPADGAPTLITDVMTEMEISLPQEQVWLVQDVIGALAQALRETGLDGARLGLVGADVLPLSSHDRLRSLVPSVRFEDAQGILDRARSIKSATEISNLAHASSIGSRMMDAVMDAARAGRTHGEVLAEGMAVLMPQAGMLYNSFMASGRGGPSPRKAAASFPTWASPDPLADGDWFKVGLSGAVEGYVFDLARSRAVGSPQPAQTALFEAAVEVVEAAIAAIRPGATAHEVARAGLSKQEALGFELKSNFSGMGHGIGLGWDVPWLTLGNDSRIEENMVLCVERTIYSDGYVGDFEETVVVTGSGARKLTDAVIRRW